jgi:hypothetical protein
MAMVAMNKTRRKRSHLMRRAHVKQERGRERKERSAAHTFSGRLMHGIIVASAIERLIGVKGSMSNWTDTDQTYRLDRAAPRRSQDKRAGTVRAPPSPR